MEEITYEIDWSLVSTVQDLINILSALEITVPESYSKRAEIQQYLILEEK